MCDGVSSLRIPLCQAPCSPWDDDDYDEEDSVEPALSNGSQAVALTRASKRGKTTTIQEGVPTPNMRRPTARLPTSPPRRPTARAPTSSAGQFKGVAIVPPEPPSESEAARTIQKSWRKRSGHKPILRRGVLLAYWERIRKAEEHHKEIAKEWLDETRLRALDSLRRHSAPMLRNIFQSIRDLLKGQALADPHLPKKLKPVLHEVTKSLVDDLELEVDLALRSATSKVNNRPSMSEEEMMEHHEKLREYPHMWWLMKVRAFILYHWLPYNRSMFGKCRDIVYVLLALLSSWPTPCVRTVYFTAILLMLLFPWPPDEYQLIGYILSFKGTAFFSTGLVGLMFISLEYFFCYLFAGDAVKECITRNGPGARSRLVLLVLDLFSTVILVWVAFILLPKSKRRYVFTPDTGTGSKTLQSLRLRKMPTQQEELDSKFNRGGRLYKLLKYDIISFVVCVIAMVIVGIADVYVSSSPEDFVPHAKELIYWIRILYGLGSLPFTLFSLPVVGRFLTHVEVTGFDEHGQCRLFEYEEQVIAAASEALA